MTDVAARPRGRPKGHRLADEVKARIGQGVSDARHASSFQTQEYYRSKIKTGRIISVLCQIAEGTIEGKPNQVAAATILLRKVLPDLATVEHTSKDGVTQLTIITGVVRAEDLANDTKTIEHVSLPDTHPDPPPEQKDK